MTIISDDHRDLDRLSKLVNDTPRGIFMILEDNYSTGHSYDCKIMITACI